jgi:hypothetical protein
LTATRKQSADQSTLNSWIRQQGAIQLPKIETTKQRAPNLSTPLSIPSQTPKRSDRFITTLNRMTCATRRDGSKNTHETLKTTDFTPHSFYLECINEVHRINRPDKMYLSDPKELVYVQNLPNLKFYTFGHGKLINSIWEIKNIYAGAAVNTDAYSLFDHLSIRDKI